MTLPFRRRHHDDESGHDRARAIWSTAMLEPIDDRDAAWLEAHLAGCAECQKEHEAYLADRSLLRSLRDRPPEPPRDLWARTAAAIEREAGRRRGGISAPLAQRLVPARARVPLGVMSGLLVALVIVAVSFTPRGPFTSGPSAGATQVALGTPAVVPSPIAVKTAPIGFVQTTADGLYELKIADVAQVCPDEKAGCAPLTNSTHSVLTFDAAPQALVGSPNNDALVIVNGSAGSHAGSVMVVPVQGSTASPPPASSTPHTAPPATEPASSEPSQSPTGSVGPTPLPTPAGTRSIAEGVTVVGEARYSLDGRWLAFSAAPIDASAGPDLYVWNGTDATATRVTSDHATYFSGWLQDQILASRLPEAAAVPNASAAATPAATPVATPPLPGASAGAPLPTESHPVSFVFDPATGLSTDMAMPDIWLPSVDKTGRFVTFWLGTVRLAAATSTVSLGTGRLVLDGWLEPLDHSGGGASASHGPAGSGTGTAGSPSGAPRGSGPAGSSGSPEASEAPAVGPAGTPIELVPGPITAFEARFDPNGARLAIWVADATDPSVGTLKLVVLDHGNGKVNAALDPLPSVRALRGFSIDEGRLAWVTPPGQDGNQSSVQVLAWSNDDFGQVQTVPGEQLTIVR